MSVTKNLDDLARDLAIEFEVGGDRFDRSDMAYCLYSCGLKPDGLEELRAKVSSYVHKECCSDEFLKKQLDYWLPDWICELGEFEHNLGEKNCFASTNRFSSNVFCGFDVDGPDSGYTVLFNRASQELHEGCIPCVENTDKYGRKNCFGVGFYDKDGYLYAITDIDGHSCGEHPGILKVEIETGKPDYVKVDPEDKQLIRNLHEVVRTGLVVEVLETAFLEMSRDNSISVADALQEGMREWDVSVDRSMKI